jgi:hypothetical protein
MDYFIIAVTTLAGLYFHWWIYVRIQRWVARDLALSMAGDDAAKREYMLARLQQAQQEKIARRQLQGWLEQQAARYPLDSAAPASGEPRP